MTLCGPRDKAEAFGDLFPAVFVRPHPYEAPLLNLKPMHPMDDFEHPIDFDGCWPKVNGWRTLTRHAFDVGAYDRRPEVEEPLDSNRRQTVGGFCCLGKS